MLSQMIDKIEIQIEKVVVQSRLDTITQYVNSCRTNDEKFDQTGFWRLKKKLCPPERDPPMAKKDVNWQHSNCS